MTGLRQPTGRRSPLVSLRQFRSEDLSALYAISLATGHLGGDASHLYSDPNLMGHIYSAPYALLNPTLVLVAVDGDGVAGFVLGALDTAAWEVMLERNWWPALRAQYPDPGDTSDATWTTDQRRAFMIHHPERGPPAVTNAYPEGARAWSWINASGRVAPTRGKVPSEGHPRRRQSRQFASDPFLGSTWIQGVDASGYYPKSNDVDGPFLTTAVRSLTSRCDSGVLPAAIGGHVAEYCAISQNWRYGGPGESRTRGICLRRAAFHRYPRTNEQDEKTASGNGFARRHCLPRRASALAQKSTHRRHRLRQSDPLDADARRERPQQPRRQA